MLFNFFKRKCFICELLKPDSFHIQPSYDYSTTYRFHKKCIEDVMNNPEKYNNNIINDCITVINGQKEQRKYRFELEQKAKELAKTCLQDGFKQFKRI